MCKLKSTLVGMPPSPLPLSRSSFMASLVSCVWIALDFRTMVSLLCLERPVTECERLTPLRSSVPPVPDR